MTDELKYENDFLSEAEAPEQRGAYSRQGLDIRRKGCNYH